MSFQEMFRVIMGLKSEDHRRIYTRELQGAEIGFSQQDTLENVLMEFTVKREAR